MIGIICLLLVSSCSAAGNDRSPGRSPSRYPTGSILQALSDIDINRPASPLLHYPMWARSPDNRPDDSWLVGQSGWKPTEDPENVDAEGVLRLNRLADVTVTSPDRAPTAWLFPISPLNAISFQSGLHHRPVPESQLAMVPNEITYESFVFSPPRNRRTREALQRKLCEELVNPLVRILDRLQRGKPSAKASLASSSSAGNLALESPKSAPGRSQPSLPSTSSAGNLALESPKSAPGRRRRSLSFGQQELNFVPASVARNHRLLAPEKSSSSSKMVRSKSVAFSLGGLSKLTSKLPADAVRSKPKPSSRMSSGQVDKLSPRSNP